MALFQALSLAKKSSGLTLIEVLVALAIVAIAMTAMIKAVSQNIRATTYLQDKTIALWVGEQVLNEVQVGLLQIEKGEEGLSHETKALEKKWYWEAHQKNSPNPRIKIISVEVFADEEHAVSLIQLESYRYEW